jgi:tetratricopeptide (TPR) repeat protein
VDLAKVPSPQRLDGIGQSHIPITTKSSEAQQWFDQGLALLHCFWDYEELRAFHRAVQLDPDCAMCHWGLAQALDANPANHEQAKQEFQKAKELAAHASDSEQRYIRAYSEQQEKEGEEAEKAFTTEMEALIARYPDDLQAKLLLAGSLIRGYDSKGDPNPGALYGQALLRNVLQEFPNNAAANHYWIHAVEGSDHPEWALESAEKLGKLAPASGHIVHMPGHIFYRVGDYERARQIFLDALKVDQQYMDQQHVAIRDDWNYQHNLAYLIAACAEEGRYAEAREHLKALAAAAPELDAANPVFLLQVGGSAIRLATRFGDWEEVLQQAKGFPEPEGNAAWARGYRDGTLAYAGGMVAAEAGQLKEAEKQSDVLDATLWRLSKEDVGSKNDRIRNRVVDNLAVSSLELRGNIASRKSDFKMRALLDDAVQKEKELGYAEPPLYSHPALESLGHALIRAAKFADAREVFQKALIYRPHSGFALYGIAVAWDKEGNREEAMKSYRAFLDAWAQADSGLAQVKAAKEYLATR